MADPFFAAAVTRRKVAAATWPGARRSEIRISCRTTGRGGNHGGGDMLIRRQSTSTALMLCSLAAIACRLVSWRGLDRVIIASANQQSAWPKSPFYYGLISFVPRFYRVASRGSDRWIDNPSLFFSFWKTTLGLMSCTTPNLVLFFVENVNPAYKVITGPKKNYKLIQKSEHGNESLGDRTAV